MLAICLAGMRENRQYLHRFQEHQANPGLRLPLAPQPASLGVSVQLSAGAHMRGRGRQRVERLEKNSMLGGLATALKWLLFRLPWPFSASFGLISVLWALFGFHYAHHLAVDGLKLLPDSWQAAAPVYPWLADLRSLIFAVTTILSFIVGFVVAYDISAFVNLLFSKLEPKRLKYPAGFFSVPWEQHAPSAPFAKSTRIGIVLAGGGAKGAYQAGAMKAIYEFLESHHALGNVKVISGTSIGSWNAMFWLASCPRRCGT
jgi:hypothetical protein